VNGINRLPCSDATNRESRERSIAGRRQTLVELLKVVSAEADLPL